MTSDRSPAAFWSLLVTGIVVAALGLVLSIVNVIAAANHDDFTVSLGGLVLGIGVGMCLLAALKWRFERIPVAGGTMVLVGAVVVGWAIGGGLDELLQDHAGGLVLAVFLMALGAAVAAGGGIIAGLNARRRATNAPDF